MAATTVALKLLVDPKSQKVLFAEAGKDFVDFLFNIMSLPVGTVVRLLTTKGMVGCLGNLYASIENLDDDYLKRKANEDTLLKLMVNNNAVNPLMLPDQQSLTKSTSYFYRCAGNAYTACRDYVASDSKSICPACLRVMNYNVTLVNPPKPQASSSFGDGGYVKGVAKFMIMDDLVVKPMSIVSSLTLLRQFNVKDVWALEEKVINVGMKEGVELLRRSLQSKTVLTDVFFN